MESDTLQERMAYRQKVLGGFLLVWLISALTMSAGYPKLYSPYSFTVVVPVFIFYAMGFSGVLLVSASALPMALLFWLSTFTLKHDKPKVGRAMLGIYVISCLLSVVYLGYSYSYGVQYQGYQHTVFIYVFNVMFMSGITLLLYLNARKPSITNAILFRITWCSWLGWCAFPWLGETI